MVAIVSGNARGVSLSSLATLGSDGVIGQAQSGNGSEQAFVNIATGNLVLRRQDEYLAGVGTDIELFRTYNSQGQFSGQASWGVGVERQRVVAVTGGLLRTDHDGAEALYTGSGGGYSSDAGAGAYDKIRLDGANYIWTDGTTGLEETYGADGRLVSSMDTDGRIVRYAFDGARLRTVTSDNGERVTYGYDLSGRLEKIETNRADGSTVSRVSYGYDERGRLARVVVDLTPQDTNDAKTYETTYSYEGESERLAGVRQSDGTSLAFTYVQVGGQHRVETIRDGLNHVTSYNYHPDRRETTVIDPVGVVTVLKYDATGQLKSVASGAAAQIGAQVSTTIATIAVDPVPVTISTNEQGQRVMSWSAASGTNETWRYQAAGAGEWTVLSPTANGGTHSIVIPTDVEGSFAYELQQTPSGTDWPSGLAKGTFEVVTLQVGHLEVQTLPVQPIGVQVTAGAQSGQWRLEWTEPATGTDTTFLYRPAGSSAEWTTATLATAGGKQWVELSGFTAGDYAFELVESANGVPIAHAIGTVQVQAPPIYLVTNAAQHPVVAEQSASGTPQLRWSLPAQGTTTTFKYKNSSGVWTTLAVASDAAAGRQSVNLSGIGAGSYQYEVQQTGATNSVIRGTVQVLPTIAQHTQTQVVPVSVLAVSNSSGLSWAAPSSGITTKFRYRVAGSSTWQTYAGSMPTSAGSQSISSANLPERSRWVEFEVVQSTSAGAPVAHATGLYYTTGSGAPQLQLGRVGSVEGGGAAIAGSTATTRDIQVTVAAQTPVREVNVAVVPGMDGSGQPQVSWDIASSIAPVFKYRTAGGAWQAATPTKNSTTGKYAVSMQAWASGVYEYQMEPTGANGMLVTGAVEVFATVPAQTLTQQVPVTTFPVTGGTAGLSWAAGKDGATTTLRYREWGQSAWSTYAGPYTYANGLKQIPLNQVPGRNHGWVEFEVVLMPASGLPTAHAVGRYNYTTRGADTVTVALGQVAVSGDTYVITGPMPTTRAVETGVAAYKPTPRLTMANAYSNTAPPPAPVLTLATPPTRSAEVWVQTSRDAVNFQSLSAPTAQVQLAYYRGNGDTALLHELRTFSYNERGDVAAIVNGAGEATVFNYDTRGNLLRKRDAAGNTVEWTYNEADRVLTQTSFSSPDPGGAGVASATGALTTHSIYNPSDAYQLRFLVTAEGRVAEYRYDSLGQRKEERAYTVGPYTGALTYEALVAAAASCSADDYTLTTMTYDARGQLRQVSGATTTQYFYEADGRLHKVIDGAGAETLYFHDGLGRQYEVQNALGLVTSIDFEEGGRRTVTKMAGGLWVTRLFDKGGRLLSESNSKQGVTQLGTTVYTYDASNRLAMTTDPTGVRTFVIYDSEGRMAGEVDGDLTLTEYRYDDANRLSRTLKYSVGVNIDLLVDASGNPKHPLMDSSPRPEEFAHNSWRTYDDAGRLGATVDAEGAVTRYTYDGASRLLEVRQFKTRFENLASLGDAPALGQIAVDELDGDRVTRNFYDKDGLLRGTLDAEGFLEEREYDAGGRVVRTQRYFNPTDPSKRATGTLEQLRPASDDQRDIRTYFYYDALGRLEAQVDAEHHFTEYGYDTAGRQTLTKRYAAKVSVPFFTWSDVAAIRPAVDPAGEDQVTIRRYDDLGRCVEEVDPSGVVTEHAYDADGNRFRTIVGYGTIRARITQAEYDVLGRVTRELSPEGRSRITPGMTPEEIEDICRQWAVQHTYDGAGRRTSTTNALGHKTLLFYDDDGRLSHTVSALGEVTETAYDQLGNVEAQVRYARRISTSGLVGGLVTAALSAEIARIQDPSADGRTGYGYDKRGLVTSITSPENVLTQILRNAFGDEYERTEALGTADAATTKTTYDRRGLVASRTDAETVTSEYSYDAFGRLYATKDAAGHIQGTNYDRFGRIVSLTHQPKDGAIQTLARTEYDAFSRTVRTYDALGNATEHTHDLQTRSVTITTPEGVVFKTTYDEFGQVTELDNGAGAVTTHSYDRDGRLVSSRVNGVLQLTNEYDRAGRLEYQKQGDETEFVKTRIEYDETGRLWKRTVDPDPGGLQLTTQYAYDGRQLTVTDPADGITRFTYDRDGRLKAQAVDPGGKNLVTQFTYDERGNTQTVESPDGTITRYTYDRVNRRTSEVVDVGGLNLTRNWYYDKLGNLSRAVDANRHATYYTYDTQGRLEYTANANAAVERNEYDDAGRVKKTTRYANTLVVTEPIPEFPDSAFVTRFLRPDSNKDAVEHHTYDLDGRRIATATALGNDKYAVASYKYDGAGRVTQRIAYANEVTGWTPGTVTLPPADNARDNRLLTKYDTAGRIEYTQDGIGAVTHRRYDGAGRLVRLTQHADDAPFGSPEQAVASAAADRVTTYGYDKAGRQVHTVDAAGAVVRNVYDKAGRVAARIAYKQAETAGVEYAPEALDDAPDVVVDRVDRYAYDSAGRQVYAVNARGGVTKSEYDKAGNVTATTAYAAEIGDADLASLSLIATVTDIGTLVRPNDSQDRKSFHVRDAAGRLRFTIDALRYVSEWRYDGVGRVTTTVRYAKELPASSSIVLDDIERTLVLSPGADRREIVTHDAAGRVRSRQDALGITEFFTYDGAGRKLDHTDKNGNVWTYGHDAAGRLTKETSPLVTRAVLDSTQPEGFRTSSASVVMEMRYDALGNLTHRIEAVGLAEERTTEYRYDALGRQIRTIHPEAAYYNFTADDLAATNAALRHETVKSVETRTTYDIFGDATMGIDAAGHYSHKIHDKLGRIVYEVDALCGVTAYKRDAFGDVTELRRFGRSGGVPQAIITLQEADATAFYLRGADDRVITTDYDRLGRAAKVTEPLTTTYDAATNKSAVAGKVTQHLYNAFGEVIYTTDGLADTSRFYDRRGLETATVDALGYLTQRTYDGLGNLETLTEFAEAITSWDSLTGYHAGGASKPEDRTTDYTYDALGRKKSETLVGVEVTANAQVTDSFDGVLQVRFTAAPWLLQEDSPLPANRLAGVALAAGQTNGERDGTYIIEWPEPAAGATAELRWRMRGTDVWNPVEGTPSTRAGMQRAVFAGGLPPGPYDLEVRHLRNGLPEKQFIGTLTVQEPTLTTQVNASSTTGTVAGVSFAQRNGANVIQWNVPANAANTVRFRYFADGQWQAPIVHTDGNVQYAVIPQNVLQKDSDLAIEVEFSLQSTTRSDLATSFTYDVHGNVTSTKDAADGMTYSYYDEFGRMTASVSPKDASDSAAPLVEYYRDALGNVVATAQRGNGAAGASVDGFQAVGRGVAFDRISTAAYDRMGRVTASTDAGNIKRYFSWDERGELAKSWFGLSSVGQVSYQVNVRDALGRILRTIEPAAASLNGTTSGQTTTRMAYNVFGEMTSRSVDGIEGGEYWDYNLAGLAWRTNEGDGIDRITVYDRQGRATMDVRSEGAGGQDTNIRTTTVDTALAASSLRRTITHYDKLGRLVKQVLPHVLQAQGGVQATHLFTTVAIQQAPAGPDQVGSGADIWKWGPSEVRVGWTRLDTLGAGDMKVELSYRTWEHAATGTVTRGQAKTITQFITSEQGATGTTFRWTDPDGLVGGIAEVTGLKVWKKDLFGNFQLLIDQGIWGDEGNSITMDAPADLATNVILELKEIATGRIVPPQTAVHFGQKLRLDMTGEPDGDYSYVIRVQASGMSEPQLVAAGTVTLRRPALTEIEDYKIATGPWGPAVYAWADPGTTVVEGFRYRRAGSTEQWLSLAVTDCGGGYNGVDTRLLPDGDYEYELVWRNSGELRPFAHNTGRFRTAAAAGIPPVTGVTTNANADGSGSLSWPAPTTPGVEARLRYKAVSTATFIDWPAAYIGTSNGTTMAVIDAAWPPDTYDVELVLESTGAAGAVQQLAKSAYRIRLHEGQAQMPTLVETTAGVDAAYAHYPTVPGFTAVAYDSGNWRVNWSAPVAGTTTKLEIRPAGGIWQPGLARSAAAADSTYFEIKATELAWGPYEIRLTQTKDGVVKTHTAMAVTVPQQTKSETTQTPVAALASTFSPVRNGWHLEWDKPASGTVNVRYRKMPSGAFQSYTGTVTTSGTKQSIDLAAGQLAAGTWEFDVYYTPSGSNPGARTAQSLNQVTIEAIQQPTLTAPLPAVPGFRWDRTAWGSGTASPYGGASFIWSKPPAGTTAKFEYQHPVTGVWQQLSVVANADGVTQSVVFPEPPPPGYNLPIRLTLTNSSGVATAQTLGTLRVDAGTPSFVPSTYTTVTGLPGLPGFIWAKSAWGDSPFGGSSFIWAKPPEGTTAIAEYLHPVTSAWVQLSTAMNADELTQSVVFPEAVPIGYDFPMRLTLVNGSGATAQSTGVLRVDATGQATYVHTTSAVAGAVPPVGGLAVATTADGTWKVSWNKLHLAAKPRMSVRQVLAGGTYGNWVPVPDAIFNANWTSNGTVDTVTGYAADLATGQWELDFRIEMSDGTVAYQSRLGLNTRNPYARQDLSPATAATINVDFNGKKDGTGGWRIEWPAPTDLSVSVEVLQRPGGETLGYATTDTTPKKHYIESSGDSAPGPYEFAIYHRKAGAIVGQYFGVLKIDVGDKATFTQRIVTSKTEFGDGKWQVTHPVAIAGTQTKVQYRREGDAMWVSVTPSNPSGGFQTSLFEPYWKTAGTATYEVEVYYEATATGARVSEAKFDVTVVSLPSAPTFVQQDTGYRPAQYSLTPDAASSTPYVSHVHTFAANNPLMANWFVVTPNGGSYFEWTKDPAATSTFRLRARDSEAWSQPTILDLVDRYRVTIPATQAPGEYDVELTSGPDGGVRTFWTGVLKVPRSQHSGGEAVISQAIGSANGTTLSMQGAVEREVDRWGNVLVESDVRNAAWKTTYRYNARNQVVEQSRPGTGADPALERAISQVRYDRLGREVAVVDANGNLNEKYWDAAGQLVAETHADGATVAHGYDLFGDRRTTRDELEAVTEYTYDRLSRLVRTNRPDVEASVVDNAWVAQASTVYDEITTWDEAGNRLSHSNGASEVTTYRYDLRGNVIETTSGGVTTWSAWDALGRKISEKRKESESVAATASWRFDYFGQLLSHSDLGGKSYTYTFDNARQLKSQASGWGQDIKYQFDRAGRLIVIQDIAVGRWSFYAYDLAGNRVRETVMQGGITYQDNHLAYDALGRLVWVADGRASVAIVHDKAGNRKSIQTHVLNGDAASDAVRFFQYDAMNRVVVADAANAAGELGELGHRIAYDRAGNKVSDTWMGNVVATIASQTLTFTSDGPNGNTLTNTVITPERYEAARGLTTEKYERDAHGRIRRIVRDGKTVDERKYDAAGRLVQSGTQALGDDYLVALNGVNSQGAVLDGNGTELRMLRYDSFGRLGAQAGFGSRGSDIKHVTSYDEWDQAGNLKVYQVHNWVAGNQYRYVAAHEKRESFMEASVTGTLVGQGTTRITTQTYDANGHLIQVADSHQEQNNRSFKLDAEGKILHVEQGVHVQRQLVVNGEVLGRYGEVVDDAEGRTAEGAPRSFKTVADFGFGFTNTGGNTPNVPDRTHTVAAGETMQGIAQAYYGDGRLWYRIAEANALSSNTELKAGQVLKVPGTEGSGNAAGSFKPYDPGEVVGDTSPHIPLPKRKSNWFAKLLMVVVAVVATVFTAGAITAAAGSSFLEIMAAGAKALAGGITGVGLGTAATATTAGSLGAAGFAATGAVGSIASQVVGVATGVQDKLSWKGVAMSALGSVVGGSLGGVDLNLGNTANAMARAAIGNTVMQGIGVVTGLQRSFDWRGVAASAVGAGVGQAVGEKLGDSFGGRLATGLVAGTAAAVLRGGKIAIQQVAVDAFGNALGRSIASASNKASATQEADPLGEFIEKNMPAWEQRQRTLDAVVDVLSNPGSISRGDGVLIADYRETGGKTVRTNPLRYVDVDTETRAPLLDSYQWPLGQTPDGTILGYRDKVGPYFKAYQDGEVKYLYPMGLSVSDGSYEALEARRLKPIDEAPMFSGDSSYDTLEARRLTNHTVAADLPSHSRYQGLSQPAGEAFQAADPVLKAWRSNQPIDAGELLRAFGGLERQLELSGRRQEVDPRAPNELVGIHTRLTWLSMAAYRNGIALSAHQNAQAFGSSLSLPVGENTTISGRPMLPGSTQLTRYTASNAAGWSAPPTTSAPNIPDKSWKYKIDGTAQRTGNDATHQIRTYREAIALAKDPAVFSVHLDHGYNRALQLDPKTIAPNRRPDVVAIYADGRVARVEVQSRTDVPAILRARNAALDAQLRAQGYTPLPPVVVRPTRSVP